MLGTMHHMQPLVAVFQTCSRFTACLQVKSVTPVGDRVFVKAEEAEAKTVGGILLPTSAQKRPTQGTVTSAGSAKAVKVGAMPLAAARSRCAALCSLFPLCLAGWRQGGVQQVCGHRGRAAGRQLCAAQGALASRCPEPPAGREASGLAVGSGAHRACTGPQ